jgi:hypothetical protein
MGFTHQSSPQSKSNSLGLWGICLVTCLAAVSTANAQGYGPMPGSLYGDPNTSTLYSPQGPQAAFGPGGYETGMMGQDMGMMAQNGMVQPGELNSLNYSQSLGDYGSMQMYGDPNGEGGIGANYHAHPATWAHVRDLQLGVYTNEEQTVINGGSTFEFYVDDHFGFGGRALLGGANNSDEEVNDEFHFSGDLYMGTTALDQHWIKGGVIFDRQDDFHKVGPAIGFLMFADRRHPISLDFAYGIGYGEPIIDRVNSTITTVADDDTQLRVGTYVTPNLQLGFSGNWINFPTDNFQDYNGYGGFVNLNLGTLSVNVDYTTGDHRDRGFVNVAYTFGGRRSRAADGCEMAYVEHPRDWLGKPVMRDVSLQIQTAFANLPPLPPGTPGPAPPAPIPPGTPMTGNGVGNITQVNCRISSITGGNNNGILEPGDQFILEIQLINNSGQDALVVSTGTVMATPSTQAQIEPLTAQNIGQIPAGLQSTFPAAANNFFFGLRTGAVSTSALAGSQFFLDFNVTADNQTRTYRCAALTVGTTTVSPTFAPATPLN